MGWHALKINQSNLVLSDCVLAGVWLLFSMFNILLAIKVCPHTTLSEQSLRKVDNPLRTHLEHLSCSQVTS